MRYPDNTDEFLTVRQVARRLDISPRTVWRWVAVGRFPAPLRIGPKFVRWRRDDLERYLDGLCDPGPAPPVPRDAAS